MAENEGARIGWTVGISGDTGKPDWDKITLTRHDPPQIVLEIDAPGIRSAGEDQRLHGRRMIQEALFALQEALDSPSALAGFRP